MFLVVALFAAVYEAVGIGRSIFSTSSCRVLLVTFRSSIGSNSGTTSTSSILRLFSSSGRVGSCHSYHRHAQDSDPGYFGLEFGLILSVLLPDYFGESHRLAIHRPDLFAPSALPNPAGLTFDARFQCLRANGDSKMTVLVQTQF